MQEIFVEKDKFLQSFFNYDNIYSHFLIICNVINRKASSVKLLDKKYQRLEKREPLDISFGQLGFLFFFNIVLLRSNDTLNTDQVVIVNEFFLFLFIFLLLFRLCSVIKNFED